MATEEPRFHALSDGDLLDLLYTAGDRLPREAVDELLRRGSRIFPSLAEIVGDKAAWTQPLPEWWAAVHATYLLGAMETPNSLVPLLCALRWADAFDCDWVTEDLPSIFGRLGPAAFEPLLAIARDPTAGPGARSVALASLAAVAFTASYLTDQVVALAAGFVAPPSEGLMLRQTAANVLADLRAAEHRDLLVSFGREEARRHREDSEYQGVFYDWEVDDLLAEPPEAALEYYRRDWMGFYDPEEIERRQERWEREQAEAREEEGSPEPATARDGSSPCTCGSGRPYGECCFLKVH
ncbi:MAG: SEC-C domain-containing protein [Deferrisomatales bacterium]|nr:SEC-C domain-containing protein [Deferrisomatales bacterium]